MTLKEQAIARSSQSAFPDPNVPVEDANNPKYQGITILEYFTAEAMKLIASGPGADIRFPDRQREIANAAADMAMIALIAIQRKMKQMSNGTES